MLALTYFAVSNPTQKVDELDTQYHDAMRNLESEVNAQYDNSVIDEVFENEPRRSSPRSVVSGGAAPKKTRVGFLNGPQGSQSICPPSSSRSVEMADHDGRTT